MRVEFNSKVVEVRVHQRPEEKETVSSVSLDGETYIAKSKCHPKDNFSKHKGLQISLSKALKKANIEKNERKLIWDKIFNHKYSKTGNN